MKKGVRRTLKALGIVVLVLVVLAGVVVWRIGAIAESAINRVAPDLLGVPVSVESVRVSVLGGTADIAKLEIGNPEGFDSPYMFHLESLHVDLSVREFLKNRCHINEIHVIGPHVWYHQKLTSNNISAFLDQLEERFPPAEGKDDEKKDEAKEEEKKGEAMPVIIDHFLFDEGTLGLKMGVGGEIPLAKIELHDIGKDGAFLPGQIVRIIVEAIFSSITSAVKGAGGALLDAAGSVGGAALKAAGSVVGVAGDAVGAAAGAVGDAAGAAVGMAGDAAGAAVGAVGDAAGAAAGAVGDAAGAAVDVAGDAVGAAADGVKAVGGAVGDAAGAVGGAAADAAGSVVKGAQAVGGAAVDAVGAVGGAAVDGAKAVGGAALDTAGAVGGAAVDAVGAVGGAAAKGVGAVARGVGSLFGGGKSAETNAAPAEVSGSEAPAPAAAPAPEEK